MNKIKFVANYDNDFNIYKSVINCFPISDAKKQLITYDDDYEYLGIFNGYGGEIKTSRDKTFGFLQEPINNINYDRNLHFYCSKIFCQDKDMFRPNKGISENFLNMFYSNHVEYHYSNFLNRTFNKQKKLCIFVSGISQANNPYWINNNYKKRIDLINKILQSNLDIDIYGRNLNISDIRYKGSPHNKHEILKDYKFSIAIENCCEKNYVSEKFFDCVLNNTIPLYYGCPNVDDIFNKQCYIFLNINSETIIDDIKQILEINTINMESSIVEARQKYFNNFNPINKFREFE
jgi:hypothetical protein